MHAHPSAEAELPPLSIFGARSFWLIVVSLALRPAEGPRHRSRRCVRRARCRRRRRPADAARLRARAAPRLARAAEARAPAGVLRAAEVTALILSIAALVAAAVGFRKLGRAEATANLKEEITDADRKAADALRRRVAAADKRVRDPADRRGYRD